jgi:hypothetical protein
MGMPGDILCRAQISHRFPEYGHENSTALGHPHQDGVLDPYDLRREVVLKYLLGATSWPQFRRAPDDVVVSTRALEIPGPGSWSRIYCIRAKKLLSQISNP